MSNSTDRDDRKPDDIPPAPTKETDKPPIPVKDWIPERPFDSAEYLDRPEPKQKKDK